MKNQLLLSTLFLVFFQIVLFGQNKPQPSNYEVAINTGFSMPLGEYRTGQLPVFYYGEYKSGYAIELDYIYHISYFDIIGTLGYMQHFSNNMLKDYMNINNNSVIKSIELEEAEFGMIYFMPGLALSSNNRLKVTAFFNAGAVNLFETQQYHITIDYINSSDPSIGFIDLENRLSPAYKGGISLQYPLKDKVNLSFKSEYFTSKIQGVYNEVFYQNNILVIENSRSIKKPIAALNLLFGITYRF